MALRGEVPLVPQMHQRPRSCKIPPKCSGNKPSKSTLHCTDWLNYHFSPYYANSWHINKRFISRSCLDLHRDLWKCNTKTARMNEKCVFCFSSPGLDLSCLYIWRLVCVRDVVYNINMTASSPYLSSDPRTPVQQASLAFSCFVLPPHPPFSTLLLSVPCTCKCPLTPAYWIGLQFNLQRKRWDRAANYT